VSEVTDIEALERFVLDNEELVALEDRVGSFNVFDALGVVHQEIKHSHFLAWLLDPGESHGFGALFLRPVLMDILRSMPPESRPFNPVELDGAELGGVQVRREWRNIDLLIECREPRIVIAIENKVYASEHSNQLSRYQKIVNEHWAGDPKVFVFLTREGDEPSEEDWTSYSYEQLHQVLSRTLRRHESTIGDDVRVFVEHYRRLIGSRLMDDPKIKELCEKIYKQHRQAIDLIVQHVGSKGSELLCAIIGFLESKPDEWHIVNSTSRYVSFVPRSWTVAMPVWQSAAEDAERPWLGGSLNVRGSRCYLQWGIGYWQDKDARQRVVDALEPFGLKRIRKGPLKPNWNSLGRSQVERWGPGEEPNIDAVMKAIERRMERLAKQLDGSADAIRNALKG